MANDIKQKIVLEGEKQYNQALSEAKRNLKTLRSELKAETAELGANATAQQKNETRMKSLQKQIREQEKIVKTYQEALKEVKEKYGDNEEAIAKWEVKLNDARTSLANMKNELEGVGQGFQKIEDSASMATVASKSVADSFGKLAEVGELISGSIETAFSGLVSTAKQVISAIWEDIVNLAARSNNLVDLAGFWNTDVTTIQKYAGAVREVSGDLQDLTSLVTKTNAGDSKKIAELTNVSVENYKDQWEYAMAVMTAMSRMSTEERNNAAFDIFGGKQATKAFDLLNDWNKLLDHLDKYDVDKGGYGLSEAELQSMSDLYDKVNGLKLSWESLKSMAEVKLVGDLAVNITSNAQNILDALLQYMNAGSDAEREEAINKIKDNITAMFEAAKEAIEAGIEILDGIAEELKKSDNPTAQALGNLLSGLVDALKWLTEDNMKNVVNALEYLAAFWITGKGLQMGLKIAEVAKDIALIKGFSLAGGGGAAAAAGAGGGGGLFSRLFGTATAAVGGGLEWLSGLGGAGGLPGVVIDRVLNETNFGRAIRDGTDILEGLTKDLKEKSDEIKSNAESFEADWNDVFENNTVVKFFKDLFGNKESLYNGEDKDWRPSHQKGTEQQPTPADALDWRPSYMRGIASDVAKEVAEDVALDRIYTEQDKENAIQDWWDAWRESAEDEASSFDWMQEVFGDQFGAVWDNIIQRLDELGEKQMELEDLPSEWWKTQGGNAGNQDGMTSADAKSMTDAVNRMPKAVAQGVSGIRVYMDGATVGRLVAPYVSQSIAAAIG